MRSFFSFMAISADGFHAPLDRDMAWQTSGSGAVRGGGDAFTGTRCRDGVQG
jgi:hypothetical protein